MRFVNVNEVYEYFNCDDLVEYIAEKGVEEVKFLVPTQKFRDFGIGTNRSSFKENLVVCKISESNYKVEDNFKITLEATVKYGGYGKEDYYTYDLASLIRGGRVKIIKL